MGQPPSNEDMYTIILGSLPPSFDSYISAVSAISSVLGITISTDASMTTVTDKYNHQLLNSKSSKKDDYVTYTNEGSSKGQKGGSKKDVECYNCHKKGHYKADCWAEGRGKEGQGPKIKKKAKGKAKEVAAAAVAAKDKVKEKVEAWMVSLAVIDNDLFDEMESLLDLESVSNSKISKTSLPESFGKEYTIPFAFPSPHNDSDASLDGLPDLESVSDSSMDEQDSPESFGKDYTILCNYFFSPNIPDTSSKVSDSLDSLSEEFQYIPMKEEAYVATYKANTLQGTLEHSL